VFEDGGGFPEFDCQDRVSRWAITAEVPTSVPPEAPAEYPCPDCGHPTDGLKRYHFVKWFVIFLAIALWRPEVHTACPACMRKYIWRRSLVIIPVNFLLSLLWITAVKGEKTLLNIFLANLILFFAFLPWIIGVTIATTRKGHSKSIVAGKPPQQAGEETSKITDT